MGELKQNGEKKKGPGGRPPKFDANNPDDVQRFHELTLEYFEYIKGEQNEKGDYIRYPEPPTVTGLSLYLGFSDKHTTYEYVKISEFNHSLKRALMKIEQFHEIATSRGDKCTGNIFILKNFGWKDKTETEITGKQEIVWKEEKTYEANEETD